MLVAITTIVIIIAVISIAMMLVKKLFSIALKIVGVAILILLLINYQTILNLFN